MLIFLPTLTLMFIPKRISVHALGFLLVLAVSGLLCVMLTEFIQEKEIKIIFAGAYLLITVLAVSGLWGRIVWKHGHFGVMKNILLFLSASVASVLAVFIFVLTYTDDSGLYDGGRNADAGVILGAAVWGGNRPSPVLKERINKGYDIYKKKIVPKLVITGGGSPNEMTEGEVSKNVLLKYGVSPEDLIPENSSSSTVEQIGFVRDKLYRNLGWKRIILISDNFHLFRASQICKFNDINADCIASEKELSLAGTVSFCIKETFAVIIFWMFGI